MSQKNKKWAEVDLYEPVQDYFTEQGYIVHGEVNDCDVVAVKKDILVIIELKLTLNIDLLIQATQRQRLTKRVYVAVPHPMNRLRSKKWRDTCHLLRRLELGLITVMKDGQVKAIHDPGPFDRVRSMRQSKRHKDKLLKEIEGRLVSTNTGGSYQTKIRTAYKESCIHIACCMAKFGPLSAQSLRKFGTGDKTYSILYNDYNEWFQKVERGIYTLTVKGFHEYKEDKEIADFYMRKVNDS